MTSASTFADIASVQGAPVDLFPTADSPSVGADPNRNNNFTFAQAGADLGSDQSRCPFSAHIRYDETLDPIARI